MIHSVTEGGKMVRKVKEKERDLSIAGQLASENTAYYVVQCVLSVSPDFPRWSSVYWHAFSADARKFQKSAIKAESPRFWQPEDAVKFMEFLNKEGQYRARVIFRHETKTELLIAPPRSRDNAGEAGRTDRACQGGVLSGLREFCLHE